MIYYIFYCISTIIMYILHYYISYCLLDFIPDLIIYWILYWIIGGFYHKCVYFVKIGSKTRTRFSLDFVLDNWWIFVKHKIYQILCKIHQISSPSPPPHPRFYPLPYPLSPSCNPVFLQFTFFIQGYIFSPPDSCVIVFEVDT